MTQLRIDFDFGAQATTEAVQRLGSTLLAEFSIPIQGPAGPAGPTGPIGGSVDATSSIAGVIRLGSDTVQVVASNAVGATAGRTYNLQLNGTANAVVNVPWTDTVYTHPNSGATAGTYSVVTVNAAGHVTSGANASSADFEITDASKGIILKSPDNSRFRITVDNDGILTTVKL